MISLCLYFLCRPVSKKFFAGASVHITSSFSGAFTFNAHLIPSWLGWDNGSAFMLVAGASAARAPADGGALTFIVTVSPSGTWWNGGSAYNL